MKGANGEQAGVGEQWNLTEQEWNSLRKKYRWPLLFYHAASFVIVILFIFFLRYVPEHVPRWMDTFGLEFGDGYLLLQGFAGIWFSIFGVAVLFFLDALIDKILGRWFVDPQEFKAARTGRARQERRFRAGRGIILGCICALWLLVLLLSVNIYHISDEALTGRMGSPMLKNTAIRYSELTGIELIPVPDSQELALCMTMTNGSKFLWLNLDGKYHVRFLEELDNKTGGRYQLAERAGELSLQR